MTILGTVISSVMRNMVPQFISFASQIMDSFQFAYQILNSFRSSSLILHLIYLCLSSAPALSSRGQHKSTLPTSADDGSRSPWKAYSNGEQTPKHEFDDSLSLGVATPLLKSFMTQVSYIIL